MRFAVLGQVALVDDEGGETTFGSVRVRALLAALLVRPNEPVSSDTLIDEVWDGDPPSGALKTLRSYVMRVRATVREALGPDMAARIVTCASGYLIQVDGAELDTLLFEELCRAAEAAHRDGRWADAGDEARRAGLLWRGEPLFGVESEALREACRPLLERLGQQRLRALEIRVEADLHSGRAAQLVPELTDLTVKHPENERFQTQLMRALMSCGRQAEALRVYEDARRVLADELGVDPGPGLQDLHRRILAGTASAGAPDPSPVVLDSALDAPARARNVLVRRWRAFAPIPIGAAVAALVTLLVVGVGGASANGGPAARAAAGAADTPNTAGAALPPPPRAGYDPLTAEADFGWLPANARNIEYSLLGGELVTTATGRTSLADMGEISTPAMLVLKVYPAGATPPAAPVTDPAAVHRIAAPDVNGRTAYWMSDTANDPTNGGETFLRWQAAGGGWFELNGYYLNTDDVTGVMLRVAAGVRTASNEVPLPLHIEGMPKSAVVSQLVFTRPADPRSTSWRFTMDLQLNGPDVFYYVTPAGGATPGPYPGTTTACKTQAGLTGCVSVTGPLPSSFGGTAGLLRNLTLLGTGPAHWTTKVID